MDLMISLICLCSLLHSFAGMLRVIRARYCLAALILLLAAGTDARKDRRRPEEYDYVVVIDAGSFETRLHVFRYKRQKPERGESGTRPVCTCDWHVCLRSLIGYRLCEYVKITQSLCLMVLQKGLQISFPCLEQRDVTRSIHQHKQRKAAE